MLAASAARNASPEAAVLAPPRPPVPRVGVRAWGVCAPWTRPVPDDGTAWGLGSRDARKLDRFSLLALAAARQALSGLTAAEIAECGIVSGTMLAGWSFTEPQLSLLHGPGLAAMSPYLATAWFPAAPQGEISIHLGLGGYAKTVTTDQCSGAAAIAMAAACVRSGRSPRLLAGGAEAPRTTLVAAAMHGCGRAIGQLSDGAAYLLLEAGGDGPLALAAHDAVARVSDTGLASLADRTVDRHRELGRPPVHAAVVAGDADRRLRRRLAADLGIDESRWSRAEEVAGDTLGASSAIAAALACERAARHGRDGAALAIAIGSEGAHVLWFTAQRGDRPGGFHGHAS